MVTYYAAMGKYRLEQFDVVNRPVVILTDKEYGVTVFEYILWNTLLWNILDYEALKASCLHRARQFRIAMSEADFDQTLDRLLLRGLIIQGQGFTGSAALHELLNGVYLVPVRFPFYRRVEGFFRLLLEGYSFRLTRHIFGPDRLSHEEKAILKALLAKPQPLTQFIGFEGAADQVGLSPLSNQVQQALATAANLYLKRMVVFEHE